VEDDNVEFDWASGILRVSGAVIRSDALEGILAPVTIRGGFIEKLEIQMPSILGSWGSAVVTIETGVVVLVPQDTTWELQEVRAARAKMVDLLRQFLGAFKPKGPESEASPVDKNSRGKTRRPSQEPSEAMQASSVSSMKKRLLADLKKRMLGRLEVRISEFEIRLEDGENACGMHIGLIEATSNVGPSELRGTIGSRPAEILQRVEVRRLGLFWDRDGANLGKEVRDDGDGIPGYQAYRSLCVRERWRIAALALRKRRRDRVSGEKFATHRYIVHPMQISIHHASGTLADGGAFRDVDIAFDPVEVSLSSQQLRAARGHADRISRWYKAERAFISRPPVKLEGKEAVAAWWRHGFSLAQALPGFPRPLFPPRERVAESARRRTSYIAALRQLDSDDSEAHRDRVAEREVYLTLREILQYRADYKNRDEEDAQEFAAGLLSNLEEEIDEEDDEEEDDLAPTSDGKPGSSFFLRVNLASAKLTFLTEKEIGASKFAFHQQSVFREHLCRADLRQFSMVASRTPQMREDSKARAQQFTLEVRLRDFEASVHRVVRWQPVLRFEPLSESEPFAVSVTLSKYAEQDLARVSCRARCGKAQVRADQRDITRIHGLFAAEKRPAVTVITTKLTASGRREIQRSLQRRVEKVLHPFGSEMHLVLESDGVVSTVRDWYNSAFEMVQTHHLDPLVVTVERRESVSVKVVDAAGASGLPLVQSLHLEPVTRSGKFTSSESKLVVDNLSRSLHQIIAEREVQGSPRSAKLVLPSLLDVGIGGPVSKWCANLRAKRPRHLRICPARRALTWSAAQRGPVHRWLHSQLHRQLHSHIVAPKLSPASPHRRNIIRKLERFWSKT
jgi:hypothetical protein